MSHSRVVDSVIEKAQQLAQMGSAPELVQFVVDAKAKYNNLLTLAKVCTESCVVCSNISIASLCLPLVFKTHLNNFSNAVLPLLQALWLNATLGWRLVLIIPMYFWLQEAVSTNEQHVSEHAQYILWRLSFHVVSFLVQYLAVLQLRPFLL